MKGLRSVFLLLAFFVQAQERQTGSGQLTAFDQLPLLQEGAYAHQVSTHDRSGYNSDGYYCTYPFLYRDGNGEYVLLDETGAGCIYRIWMTYSASAGNGTNRFRVYFDDEPAPQIDMALDEFFSGTNAPFLFPLTGDERVSSGGYYSYVPLPYTRRCKVTVSDVQRPFYYNLSYHRFDSSDGVQTWIGTEDLSDAVQMWSVAGSDPTPEETVVEIVSGSVSVFPGGVTTLFSRTGSGTVASFRVDPATSSPDVLTNIWIRMTWDSAPEPQVSAPLGEFFGSGFGEMEVRSLPVGMSASNAWYCYFPMPFWSNAVVQLENRGADAVDRMAYEIRTISNAYPKARSGHFYAQARRSVLSSEDRDYVILDEEGRGHFVGCVLSMTATHESNGKLDMRYLEGDERIYIDGSPSPSMYGTGNEDYFNGGWYFKRGTFSLPTHGSPYQKHDPTWDVNIIETNCTGAYRFHLSDVIPFRSRIRFGIEHGDCYHYWNLPGIYSSVAYFYKKPAPALSLSAELDIGNSVSEQMFSYSAEAAGLITNQWCYEGVNDDVLISDTGSLLSGACSFSVPVEADNRGVILRRRTDQGLNPQMGEVFVDGVSVGTWALVDTNFTAVDQRWIDAEFYIPWPFSAGKTNLDIRIEPTAGAWNEYRYQVYSVAPLIPSLDMDQDGLPDRWEGEYFADIRAALPEQDHDQDGYSQQAEWIAGSNPAEPGSVFQIHAGASGQTLDWPAVSGRVYAVSWTPDLTEPFQLLEGGIPWTQNSIAITNNNAYYRVEVRLEP